VTIQPINPATLFRITTLRRILRLDSSLKFQNQILEDLALANIRQQFSDARKKHRH
jgi:hypothetical protein